MRLIRRLTTAIRVLLNRPINIRVKAKRGAYQSFMTLPWLVESDDWLLAEIPIKKSAGTSTPMGYVAPGDEQKLIDAVTVPERWPEGPDANPDVDRLCPFCGQKREHP